MGTISALMELECIDRLKAAEGLGDDFIGMRVFTKEEPFRTHFLFL